jgi:ATP-dependent RNA helicase HelY
MLRLLEQRGFVRGWGLTESGERLRYIYSELDILVAEAVARGVLDDLTPAEMAAVVSAFVYEPRNADEIADWPTPRTAERGESLERLWLDLTAEEAAFHLPTTRKPERGFAAVAYYWASGIDLGDLFEDGEFAAGDFVRNCRQLLDLLRQIRESYARVAGVAADAAAAIDRGVVAAGGLT